MPTLSWAAHSQFQCESRVRSLHPPSEKSTVNERKEMSFPCQFRQRCKSAGIPWCSFKMPKTVENLVRAVLFWLIYIFSKAYVRKQKPMSGRAVTNTS